MLSLISPAAVGNGGCRGPFVVKVVKKGLLTEVGGRLRAAILAFVLVVEGLCNGSILIDVKQKRASSVGLTTLVARA